MAGESIAIEKLSRRLTGQDASFIYGESRRHLLGLKQFSVGHRCNFCGQEIVYLLPDSAAEAFGVLFQERTFLKLRSAEIRDPSRQVAESWYCSDYCARDDLDVRINQREEQMRQHVKPRKKAKSQIQSRMQLSLRLKREANGAERSKTEQSLSKSL